MPPSHSKDLEGLGGCDCCVRPAHPENSGEPTSRENLCGNFFGIFQENPLAIPSKIHGKIRRKSAEKSAKEAPLKICQKILRMISLPENPSWKHAPSSSCDRLSVAVSLNHLSGVFWMFNRALRETKFTVKSAKKTLTLCNVSGSSVLSITNRKLKNQVSGKTSFSHSRMRKLTLSWQSLPRG